MHTRRYNGLKTAALLGLLSALMLLAGQAFGGTTGLVIALMLALATNGIAYFFSDKIALRSMHARPVEPGELPRLQAVVTELAAVHRMPPPRLYVSPAAAPNAFATGRNPRNAAVCVTSGILEILNERELRAVLGHELAHVANRDVLTASIAGGIASVVMFLASIAQWATIFGGDEDDEGAGGFLGTILLIILGPIAATLIQLAIGRSREYAADQSGATITQDPLALASALRKIEQVAAARPLPQTAELAPTSSLMIANPFRAGGLGRLFSTHPPVAERVRRLEQMAGRTHITTSVQ
jgi:heat shock protein HtpX